MSSAGCLAPLTKKVDPGSDSNTAPSVGLLTQSCAQAKRAAPGQRHAVAVSADRRSERQVRCACRSPSWNCR